MSFDTVQVHMVPVGRAGGPATQDVLTGGARSPKTLDIWPSDGLR